MDGGAGLECFIPFPDKSLRMNNEMAPWVLRTCGVFSDHFGRLRAINGEGRLITLLQRK
jgi:hypothetical protein